MSRIRRGIPNRIRKNAKNFIFDQSQRRLDESVAPFNQQVWNSLQVNAVEADLYTVYAKTGKPCSCEKIEVSSEIEDVPDSNVKGKIPTQNRDSSQGVNIQLKNDDFFGHRDGSILDDVVEYDVSGDRLVEPPTPEGNTEYEAGLFSGRNIDCGICYRTGKQPGYTSYGKQRNIFTHYNVENLKNYWINTTETPHTMELQGSSLDSFVLFSITVPKFFISATYSVRDNTDILKEMVYTPEGQPVNLDTLKKYSGNKLYFIVKAEIFTHVVFEFQINEEKVKVNLSEEMRTLDFSMFDTISNMTVVLPPYIHEVKPQDVLVLRKRRLVLKVTDVTKKITAKQRRLEWVVQSRIIQPNESLRYIGIAHRIGQFN